MQVTSYLNLNFDDDVPFPERVDLAASAGVDGIELFGWDLGTETIQSAADEFYGAPFDPDIVVDRIDDYGLELVYMSGNRPPLTDPAQADVAVESIERSLELADGYGCRTVNVKTGPTQPDLSREAQRRNIVDVLRRAAPAAEAADATVILEPINPMESPDHFIHTVAEGCAIVDTVDSPGIRLLFDIYHEQRTRGNIVESLRETLSEYAAHIHVADSPDRGQPGTGELNWELIFETIAASDPPAYIGGEFIPQGDPVEALETLVACGERF